MGGRQTNRVRFAVCVAALLLVGYLGSYVALLRPAYVVLIDGASCERLRAPAYRAKGETVRAVFAPAAWLDQQLRPDYWYKHIDFTDQPGGDDFPPPD
jgi:hypothetical protein